MKKNPEKITSVFPEYKLTLSFMPKMFVKSTFLIFLIGFSINSAFAQAYEDLYLLYDNHKINQLAARLGDLEKRRPADPEIIFFKAVFLENGDEAMAIYRDLFAKSSGKIKNLIAAKMSAYYFAQGYYVKANEYAKLAGTNFPVKTQEYDKSSDNKNIDQESPANKPVYIIQVGAFGVRQNAEDLANVLQRRKIDARLVTRQIEDKDLFCVWIDGSEDYVATKTIAEEIRQKYKLTYRILKP